MKILTTGKGTSGSWQCRGVQLGGQLGKVKARASIQDCQEADVVIVVKRVHPDFFKNVVNSGRPWVWDLVDLYPQPQCTKWSKQEAVLWVNNKLALARPDGIIWPNLQMKKDCVGFGGPGAVVYHHARNSPLNPIRETVKVVGYEGSPKFLGKWRTWLAEACRQRGWLFKEGIPIADMDIVVALRDKPYSGYPQRHWKSNVKLANAHGTGTPFVGQAESSYKETCTGSEYFIETPEQLANAFDYLEPYETRLSIHKEFIKNTFTLESRAEQVRKYVQTLRKH